MQELCKVFMALRRWQVTSGRFQTFEQQSFSLRQLHRVYHKNA